MNKEEILSTLQGLENIEDDEGTKIIASLLAMNDDEFSTMAPIIKESLKKEMASPEVKLAIIQALRTTNIKYEDLLTAFEAIQNIASTELEMSDEKKDFLVSMFSYILAAYDEADGVKRNIQVPVEKAEDTQFPTYATDGAAGADVYAIEDVTIGPGETKIIPTGLKMEIPHGYAILVQMRSGLAAKTKLRLANGVGLIDEDYRGEIGIILENTEPRIKDLVIDENGHATGVLYGQEYTITRGERIAQLRLVEVPRAFFYNTSKVTNTTRGDGGYGSTGK